MVKVITVSVDQLDAIYECRVGVPELRAEADLHMNSLPAVTNYGSWEGEVPAEP